VISIAFLFRFRNSNTRSFLTLIPAEANRNRVVAKWNATLLEQIIDSITTRHIES
jgi:hypothetical protein